MPEVTVTAFCEAGLWPGVGPALSAELADAGITTAAAVTERALAALPSVTDKRARRLYSAWIGAAHLFELCTVLSTHQLPVRWTRRLTDLLGDAAAAALLADPWQLLALPEAEVADADRLARAVQPEVRFDDPRRSRALLVRVLVRQAREGHTATPIPLVAEELRHYGLAAGPALDAAESAQLARLVADPGGGPEPWAALWQLAAAEDDIARHLDRLARTARPLAGSADIAAVSAELDPVQQAAVQAAAAAGVSLLTGGPGTGKSRTVTAVVALAGRLGLVIALAAPTGRAAKRLSELLQEHPADPGRPGGDGAAAPDIDPAMTIHRLLGARPAGGERGSVFDRDEDDPITAEIVVIDEVSMLDAELAAALLRAIPDGAHLVLVGDPAQLPSIGAGRVLGDILAANRFPTVELTTLYRQSAGGAIARLATAARAGELVAAPDADREVVVVPAADGADAARRVVQLVTDSIPRVFGLSAEQIQVVTPIHRGPAGTEALNRALKKVLNPGPHPGSRTLRGFDPGDRVVATANHLDAQPTGYANGEIGTVIDTAAKSIFVSFAGGGAEISGKALGDLQHGWAVTVHRAQGSEWEAVVVVLPPEAGRMLSRPLVYTALTRARRHLSVVHAAGPALARAVRHIGARPRRTRLGALLAATDGQSAQEPS